MQNDNNITTKITEQNIEAELFRPEPRIANRTSLNRIHKQAVVLGRKIIATTPDTDARQESLRYLKISTRTAMQAIRLGELA